MRTMLLLTAAALALCGCVERMLLIRSEPDGAPVWVNEQYVGRTPVDYEFDHYGTSEVRVGPLRDEDGNLVRRQMSILYDAEAPWYETFPIDFFFEVLYPLKLVDAHRVPTFELREPVPVEEQYGEEGRDQLIERARAYRERALLPVPDVETD